MQRGIKGTLLFIYQKITAKQKGVKNYQDWIKYNALNQSDLTSAKNQIKSWKIGF